MNIYTIGYEKKNIFEYIEILKKEGIKIIIDVRETAWSYKRDFCKNKFMQALNEQGIKYIHLKQLGNPKLLRQQLKDVEGILFSYKSYLEKTNAGIEELLKIIQTNIKKSPICLTCFEKDHLTCHRSVIIDHIRYSLTGVNIIHL